MSTRTRRLGLAVLLLLGIVGALLVITATEDGPALSMVVTEEGLVTEIPAGWVQSEQFAFEWRPIAGGVAEVFDKWTIARACGPAGCELRSLESWLAIGRDLPTFVQATTPDGRDGHRVVEGRTAARTTIVFVASLPMEPSSMWSVGCRLVSAVTSV